MSINEYQPSIAQLMSYQISMSTRLLNLCVTIEVYCSMLGTPRESKESSTFSYGNIPEYKPNVTRLFSSAVILILICVLMIQCFFTF